VAAAMRPFSVSTAATLIVRSYTLPMAWFGSCFPGGVAIRFLFPVLFVLQADSVAFYSDYPTWSVCFENTVLTWVVCGLLWIGAPFYWLYLWRRDLDIMKTSVIAYCRRSSLNIAKLVINLRPTSRRWDIRSAVVSFLTIFIRPII